MTDQVLSQTFTMDDQLSANADRMAAALDGVGASAEVTEQKVTKAGASASTLKGRFDDVTRYSNQLATALRTAAAAQVTLDDDMARGTTTADEAQRVMDALAGKVQAAQARLVDAQVAAAGLGDALAGSSRGASTGAAALDQMSTAAQRAAQNQAALRAATQPDAVNDMAAATRTWTDLIGLNGAQLREWSDGIASSITATRDLAAATADTTKAGQDMTAAFAALDGLRERYVPLAAAARQASEAVQEIRSLESAGILTSQEAAQAIDKATASYVSMADAATQAAEAQAKQAQASINAATGVDTTRTYNVSGGSQTNTSFASDREAAYQEQFAAAAADADKLRASLVPLYAIEQARDAEIEKATQAAAAGIISQDEMTAAVSRANTAFTEGEERIGRLADSTKVAGYVWKDVEDQAHKFADQVIAGGSALKAAEFQLPLMIQELGGFSNVLKIAGDALMGPIGIAIGLAAVTGALVLMGDEAEHAQARMNTLTTQLRATRDDAGGMAKEVTGAAMALAAANPGVAPKEARAASQTIAANPDFTGTTAQLQALDQIAVEVSKVFNVDLSAAAETVAKAMADPAAEAQDLADKHFPAMSQALVETVKHLEETGDKAGAADLVLQALATGTAGATATITPLQKALDGLHESFEKPLSDGKSMAQEIGEFSTDIAVKAVDALSASLQQFGAIWDQIHGRGTAASNPTSALSFAGVAQTGAALGGMVTNGLFDLGVIDGHNPGGATIGVDAATMIQKAAAARGYDSDSSFSKLAVSIGAQESDGRQFDKSGGVLTSAAGALGLMQVMPSNAAGNDLSTADGNTAAGVTLLAHLWSKYSGNMQVVAAAYNWGEGNVDNFLANGGTLPTETANYVKGVTGKPLGVPDTAISDPFGGSGAGAGAKAAATPFGLSNTAADVQNAADKKAASDPDIAQQRDAIEREIEAYQKATDATHDYSGQIDALRGKEADLLDPQAKITRGLADQLPTLNQATGFTKAMADVQVQFAQAARSAGQAVNDNDLGAAEADKVKALASAYDEATAALTRKANADEAALPLYEQGGEAVQHATDYQTAYNAALDDYAEGSPAFVKAVDDRTAALDRLATQASQQQTAAQVGQDEEQLKMIAAETGAIGMNSEARAVLIARMQAEYDEHQKFGDVLPPEAQKYVDLQAAVAASSAAMQHQEQVMSDLQSDFSSIADTVGNDITQAFTQGSGSAVKFSTVISGIETQLVTMALKLAVLNPLMNSLFGGSAATLSDLGGFLSSGASGIGGGGGSVAAAGAAGIAGVSGSTGGTGILSSLGSLLSGGSGALVPGIDKFFQSNLGFGAQAPVSLSTIEGNAIGTSSIAPGLVNGGTSNLLGGFSSASNVLGIAGSVLPGLVSGNYAQAAAGGAGAALGTAILPGIGTAIGGLAGNLLGGLFGGHKKNPYADVGIGVADGQFDVKQVVSQITDPNTAAIAQQLSAMNTFLTGAGITIAAKNTDPGAKGYVGHIGSGVTGLNQSTSFDQVAGDVRYNSSDGMLQQALDQGLNSQKQTSASGIETTITALQQTVTVLEALGASASKFSADGSVVVQAFTGYTGQTAQALASLTGKTFSASTLSDQVTKIETLTETTIPDLLAETASGSSSFQSSIKSVEDSFESARQAAVSYGLSVDSLTAHETDLVNQMFATQQATLDEANRSVQARDLAATGEKNDSDLLNFDLSAADQRKALQDSWEQTYGAAYAQMSAYSSAVVTLDQTLADERLEIATAAAKQQAALYTANTSVQARDLAATGDKQGADLMNFDVSAAQQQQALADSWQAAYGPAYAQMAAYSAAVVTLDKTLADERLQIAKENETAVSAEIVKLSDYATSLATSSASPLSPVAQYQAAQASYSQIATKAEAGDYTAITELQAASQTLLQASKVVNGGDFQYTQDFSTVESTLQAVGSLPTDTLTNSYVGAQIQDLKGSLVDQLQLLRSDVASLKAEMAQNTRVAAAAA